MRTVLIAIQARSTSTRLPNKAHMRVGGKPIVKWVIDSCQEAQRYLRFDRKLSDTVFEVALLTPVHDPIAAFYRSPQIPVIEGDEHDVLSRFVIAQREFNADYVVRITADCLFIPAHHITKHIKAALFKQRDYTTNTHWRTFKEGWDCEVISARLLEWLDENATSTYDREHVTTRIARGNKFPFTYEDGKPSICHIMNDIEDESSIKTSIDTLEEFEQAFKMNERLTQMRAEAKNHGLCQK